MCGDVSKSDCEVDIPSRFIAADLPFGVCLPKVDLLVDVKNVLYMEIVLLLNDLLSATDTLAADHQSFGKVCVCGEALNSAKKPVLIYYSL